MFSLVRRVNYGYWFLKFRFNNRLILLVSNLPMN